MAVVFDFDLRVNPDNGLKVLFSTSGERPDLDLLTRSEIIGQTLDCEQFIPLETQRIYRVAFEELYRQYTHPD